MRNRINHFLTELNDWCNTELNYNAINANNIGRAYLDIYNAFYNSEICNQNVDLDLSSYNLRHVPFSILYISRIESLNIDNNHFNQEELQQFYNRLDNVSAINNHFLSNNYESLSIAVQPDDSSVEFETSSWSSSSVATIVSQESQNSNYNTSNNPYNIRQISGSVWQDRVLEDQFILRRHRER